MSRRDLRREKWPIGGFARVWEKVGRVDSKNYRAFLGDGETWKTQRCARKTKILKMIKTLK